MSYEIKFVKLVNGDMFIAEVNMFDGKFLFKNPVTMVVMPNNQGIGAIPYLPFAKGDGEEGVFSISREQVLLVSDPEDEVTDGYKQQLAAERAAKSGLVLPNSALNTPSLKIK